MRDTKIVLPDSEIPSR